MCPELISSSPVNSRMSQLLASLQTHSHGTLTIQTISAWASPEAEPQTRSWVKGIYLGHDLRSRSEGRGRGNGHQGLDRPGPGSSAKYTECASELCVPRAGAESIYALALVPDGNCWWESPSTHPRVHTHTAASPLNFGAVSKCR